MSAFPIHHARRARTARIVTAVETVADQGSCSMAQVALACLRARPVPIIPIIGARELSQLQDNLGSFDLSLSADQMKALEGGVLPGNEARPPARCVRWWMR